MQTTGTIALMMILAASLPAQDKEIYIPIPQANDHSLQRLSSMRILESEINFCVQESWGETKTNSKDGWEKVPPGISSDILHPYRQLFAQIPRTSLHLVTKGGGAERATAFIFTIRLHNLRRPKIILVKWPDATKPEPEVTSFHTCYFRLDFFIYFC